MQRDKLKRFPVPLPRLDTWLTWPGQSLESGTVSPNYSRPPKKGEQDQAGFICLSTSEHVIYVVLKMQFYLDWVIDWGIR